MPNHAGVAVPPANPAWWDVLRRGRDSAYADWFDIDWDRGRLLLPVLADDPAALDDLKLVDGELRYHEHRFPVADGTGDGSAAEVHDRQHYQLVSWRRGDAELTYRRFFAIAGLAGLRVEDPAVFAATHELILRWAAAGEVDGIRVDHPDGLRDPAGYLTRLRAAAPDAWLVVEKILEYGEELPDWPVDGTTGYDALAMVGGLFIDIDAEGDFTALDNRLTGQRTSWEDLTHTTKLAAATQLLAAELTRLAALAPEVPTEQARAALAELAAAFDVYRGYPPHGARHLAAARSEAGRRRPDLAGALDAITRRLRDPDDELGLRFPQLTGAVMAKGVEDTAFYRWTRFVALNEVGDSPTRFGVPPAEFHRFAAAQQVRWPASMTTLSTHDTKRGEDVRARLAVLSELPGRWAERVKTWMEYAPLPDPALAHLLWQTAVGAWPIERERLHAYAEKAAREAGASTSWADPDPAFEQALHAAGRPDVRRPEPARRADRTRRRDHPGRLVQLPRAEADPAHHARGARHLPGHRAVGQLAGRPGQPPPGRLRRTPRNAGADRRRLASPDRHRRSGEAARRVADPAAAAGAPGAVHHLPAGARARAGGPARGGVRPGRRDRRGHPAAARPGPRRWVV